MTLWYYKDFGVWASYVAADGDQGEVFEAGLDGPGGQQVEVIFGFKAYSLNLHFPLPDAHFSAKIWQEIMDL